MLHYILCIALLVPNLVNSMYSCTAPSMNGSNWVIGPDGKECVSVVKVQCSGLAISTTEWKKGVQVKSICATIPSYTAIATFSGPEGCYGGAGCSAPYQHAAIFESCQYSGINVIDQWNRHPIHHRLIRYSGNNSNDGDNYYTIEK